MFNTAPDLIDLLRNKHAAAQGHDQNRRGEQTQQTDQQRLASNWSEALLSQLLWQPDWQPLSDLSDSLVRKDSPPMLDRKLSCSFVRHVGM